MKTCSALVMLVVGLAAAGPAIAGADPAACIAAYEKAQEEKAKSRFTSALAQLKACVDPQCPKFIRDDCSRWIDQVEAALPSVVFAVRRDGQDQTQADIQCDGNLLTHALDGKAIPVDPGLRTFSIAIPGFAPATRQLLIREGERSRIVDVEFRSPAAGTLPVSVASGAVAPEPGVEGNNVNRTYLTYGLAGAGALGIAGFGLFAALGYAQEQDLEGSCAPYCQSSKKNSVKTKYLVADACLGIGLVSLGVATYLYLSGRSEADGTADASPATAVGFVPSPSGEGGMLQLSRRF